VVGLAVDELLEQHQVVIKSLENNFTQVPGTLGATILGDGTVSLIVDIAGLVRLSGVRTDIGSATSAAA
jgi:two-component system chemotaxis sensor kinase CheA